MDSDDEITPDCIEKHYKELKDSDAELSIANICLKGSKSIHVKPLSDAVKQNPLRASFFKRMWNISAANKFYRK